MPPVAPVCPGRTRYAWRKCSDRGRRPSGKLIWILRISRLTRIHGQLPRHPRLKLPEIALEAVPGSCPGYCDPVAPVTPDAPVVPDGCPG